MRNSETALLYGCGKLNYRIVCRALKRTLTDINGNSCPGLSKYEILTLIYISQIADRTGFVTQYKTADLASVIGCSNRDVYFIISNLIKKGFITATYYEDLNWSGIKNITLLNNDFSKIKKYDKNTRYMSSFFQFFNFTDSKSVQFLSGLSLYALKTLLYISSNYNYRAGNRFSFRMLADELGIKNYKLILTYLKELESYLGHDYCKVKKIGTRVSYKFFFICPNNSLLQHEAAPVGDQDSYYKRHWRLRILNNGYQLGFSSDIISQFLTYMFSSIYRALEENTTLTLANIEQEIEHQFELNNGFVDLVAASRAFRLLRELPTSS